MEHFYGSQNGQGESPTWDGDPRDTDPRSGAPYDFVVKSNFEIPPTQVKHYAALLAAPPDKAKYRQIRPDTARYGQKSPDAARYRNSIRTTNCGQMPRHPKVAARTCVPKVSQK